MVIKNKLILLVLLSLFLGISFLAYRKYHNQDKAREDIIFLKKELEEQQKDKIKLEEELGLLNSPAYIERLAREKLNLKKPGEQVLIIKETEEIIKKEEINIANWQKWFRWIFRRD